MKHLSQKDYRISDWSGGKTIQIAIGPADAVYADRDFLWRVSSATVDLPESDYSSLPDYMRFITPLRGEMRLSHNGAAAFDLETYEIHYFDGADATHSWGCCTDFNLMLRKGVCDGSMISFASAERPVTVVPEEHVETMVVYCTKGSVTVSCENGSVELAEKESALLSGGRIGPVTLEFADGGRAVAAEMWPVKE